jgi:hypothetical protein
MRNSWHPGSTIARKATRSARCRTRRIRRAPRYGPRGMDDEFYRALVWFMCVMNAWLTLIDFVAFVLLLFSRIVAR